MWLYLARSQHMYANTYTAIRLALSIQIARYFLQHKLTVNQGCAIQVAFFCSWFFCLGCRFFCNEGCIFLLLIFLLAPPIFLLRLSIFLQRRLHFFSLKPSIFLQRRLHFFSLKPSIFLQRRLHFFALDIFATPLAIFGSGLNRVCFGRCGFGGGIPCGTVKHSLHYYVNYLLDKWWWLVV